MSIMSFPHVFLNMQFLQFFLKKISFCFITFHLKTSTHNFFNNYAIETYFMFIFNYHYFFICTWHFSQENNQQGGEIKIYMFCQM
jgi:hypothetical protein